MGQILRTDDPGVWRGLKYPPALKPFDPDERDNHGPNLYLALIGENESVRARCSLWWDGTPAMPGQRIGLIGHYSATGSEGADLLKEACRELAVQKCSMAVGPMEGSTWGKYRLVVDRGIEPPFFLEPDNPADWPSHFENAGFGVLATYVSSLNADLGHLDAKARKVEERMVAAGIKVRAVDMGRIEDELKRVYELSLVSFSRNYLYSPIPEDMFLRQYRKLLPALRPDLVLLAEQGDRLAGFLLGIPDHLQVMRGQAIDTFIIKTLAILPGRQYAGLGVLLAARIHAKGHELGFKRAIHALMHESNESLSISSRCGAPIRRYALFSMKLV